METGQSASDYIFCLSSTWCSCRAGLLDIFLFWIIANSNATGISVSMHRRKFSRWWQQQSLFKPLHMEPDTSSVTYRYHTDVIQGPFNSTDCFFRSEANYWQPLIHLHYACFAIVNIHVLLITGRLSKPIPSCSLQKSVIFHVTWLLKFSKRPCRL